MIQTTLPGGKTANRETKCLENNMRKPACSHSQLVKSVSLVSGPLKAMTLDMAGVKEEAGGIVYRARKSSQGGCMGQDRRTWLFTCFAKHFLLLSALLLLFAMFMPLAASC